MYKVKSSLAGNTSYWIFLHLNLAMSATPHCTLKSEVKLYHKT